MIQFNLLPDIKLTYIKAQRNKHLVMLSSMIVAGSALAILILLFLGVSVFQKQHLSDLNKDISKDTQSLKNTPELNKVLTIQNQLNSLTALHDKKPAASRIFNYLTTLTPNSTSIKSIDVDFVANTVTISGNADSINTINKFVDTLKFTNYSVDDGKDTSPAFSKVVLVSYNIGDAKSGKKSASYQITFSFDPTVFDNTKKITLTVPKKISTRSETEKPDALFDTPTDSSLTQQGN